MTRAELAGKVRYAAYRNGRSKRSTEQVVKRVLNWCCGGGPEGNRYVGETDPWMDDERCLGVVTEELRRPAQKETT